MGSVWDQPGADPKYDEQGVALPQPGSIPTVDPANTVYGTAGGRGLLQPDGTRGVYNGVPLGETRLAEEQALETQYRLRPSWLAALRAKTRAALGR